MFGRSISRGVFSVKVGVSFALRMCERTSHTASLSAGPCEDPCVLREPSTGPSDQ